MAFTFKIDGIEVVADSPADAAALITQLRRAVVPKPPVPPVPTAPPAPNVARRPAPPAPPKDEEHDGALLTRTFLTAIQSAAANGVGTDQMQRLLGVDHPKGIGSKTAIINGWLRSKNIVVDEVYTRSRTSALGRIWVEGPKLASTLAKVQEALGAR